MSSVLGSGVWENFAARQERGSLGIRRIADSGGKGGRGGAVAEFKV